MQFCSQPQQHEYVESPFVPLLVLLPICLSLANCSKKRESMPIFGRHLHGVWLRGDSEVWAVGNDGFIVYSNNGGTTWQLQVSGTIEALQLIYGRGSELWALGVGGTILHSPEWPDLEAAIKRNGARLVFGFRERPAFDRRWKTGRHFALNRQGPALATTKKYNASQAE
jgi:hypothetical protein